VNIINVVTAKSMAEECIKRFPECDIAILAAAVADYTPEEFSATKLKKNSGKITITLRPTTDIARELGKTKRPGQIVVGFALETDNELENAKKKLVSKNLDLIVLNSLKDNGAGFGYDTNIITLIDRNNNIDKFELKSKEEVARDILDRIISIIE
jgi:phosphopantothenoylcysteine decarboxylase/phosphopantothenate--cysteine ligase